MSAVTYTPASGVGSAARVTFDGRGFTRDGVPHLFADTPTSQSVATAACGRRVRVLTIWQTGTRLHSTCTRCEKQAGR